MALISIDWLSTLKGANRIDAERYNTEKKAKSLQFNYVELGSIAFITDGQHGYFKIDLESDVRQITAKHIKNGIIYKEDADKLSLETHSKNLRSSLEERDVVLSTVGTVGNVAVVDESIPTSNIDQNVARIKSLDEKVLNPYYLAIFLMSSYGKDLINENISGQVQKRISLTTLKTLRIPLLLLKTQKEVEELYKKSQNLMISSEKYYLNAEELLLEKLGLNNFEYHKEKSYISSFSNVFEVNRFDAEYFQPFYDNLIEYLDSNFTLKPLNDFLLDLNKGTEVGSKNYVEEGIPFIRVSNVSTKGLIDKDQKYIKKELYNGLKNKYEVKIGDFLLTKDASPGIAYLVKELTCGITSSGILKLDIDDSIKKEYLAICINSIIGKLQIEREVGGSVIKHWRPKQIKNLKIPFLPIDSQIKIVELVQKSFKARKMSEELLEKAKNKVENAIKTELKR